MKRQTTSRALGALLAGLCMAGGAAMAQTWPTRPVTIMVGVPAGGALDPFARALADQLNKTTGGTFIVDNRPGANGNLSAEMALKATDGNTLWIGTQSMMTINPAAFAQLRWKPSDFVPVLKAVEAPLVLVTNPSVKAKNFAELAQWIKDPANKASYASFSPGTPSHFLGYQLNEKLKAKMVHIPYKGSAPQITDILGGQVPFGFTQLASATDQGRQAAGHCGDRAEALALPARRADAAGGRPGRPDDNDLVRRVRAAQHRSEARGADPQRRDEGAQGSGLPRSPGNAELRRARRLDPRIRERDRQRHRPLGRAGQGDRLQGSRLGRTRFFRGLAPGGAPFFCRACGTAFAGNPIRRILFGRRRD